MASPTETDYKVEFDTTPGPRELERTERRNMIVRLRKGGATLEEIQHSLANLTPPIHMKTTTIARHIQRYLAKLHREESESIDQLRALENQRLDQLYRSYIVKAVGGNIRAAQMCLNISKRRAQMNGLDAPQKHEHQGAIEHLLQLGVDVKEVARAEKAFVAAFERPGLPDPDIIEGEIVEEDIDETLDARPEPVSSES